MKVMQVIDSGGLYGAEKVVLNLMEALKPLGVETELASIAEPGEPPKAIEEEAERKGMRVRRVTMKRGPDRATALRLCATAREEGFDILHTHAYKANILISGLSRPERQMPAVATLHGWTTTRALRVMRLYEMLERRVLRNADRVVAVSRAMRDRWHLDRRYGEKLRIVRNGIPPERNPADEPDREFLRRMEELAQGRPTILAAGRLSREKGFDILMEALALLVNRGLDPFLVLLGEGRERDSLREQAEDLGIGGRIWMPGYVTGVRGIIAQSQVLAIPSRTEGLPILLLEAVTEGIPVVASSVGEMPFVIESCGVGTCCAPENAGSLAGKLAGVLDQDNSEAPRSHVAQKGRSQFSSSAMASGYWGIYEELREA